MPKFLYSHRDTSSRKFGTIPPTAPDDIIQSTSDFLANFRIFGVKKLLGADPCPMKYALGSVGHRLANVKILASQAPYSPWDMSVRKSWTWVGRNTGPIFRRLWAKVHLIWCARTGVIAVCNAVFRWRYLVPIRKYLQFSEIAPKFWCFWAEGPPNFWPSFVNYSQHRTCGKVVTIGSETSEIRRRKK